MMCIDYEKKARGKVLARLALASFLTTVFPQPASALGTGVSVLDSGIAMISQLFNIESLQSNSYVQAGFLKLALFVVIFSASFLSLQKSKIFSDAQGRKTAGVVALAFSLIGVFMMPHEWLLATGWAITAVMSSLIFLGFFIGLSIVSVFVLKPKSGDDKMGFVKNLLGLMLLFVLLSLLDEWALFVGLPTTGVMISGPLEIRAYSLIISWTYVLISLLIVVKIIMLSLLIGSSSKDDRHSKLEKDAPKEPKRPKEKKEPGKKSDFSEQLLRLGDLVNRFFSTLEEFFDSCNQILITHHNHVNSGRGYEEPLPDVSEEQWQRNNQLMAKLTEIGNEINTQINAIAGHADYRNMAEEQNRQFMELLDKWQNLQSRIMDFINDFRRRYENADSPGR